VKTKHINRRSIWLIGGGMFASFLASLCCVGPLLLTILGISGAAALSKLEAIRGPMLLLVAILFGTAGIILFRDRNSCEPGTICADPKNFRKMLVIYWIGVFSAVFWITSPYWIAWLFS